jgi:DNA-binding NtrC family response regulator
MVESRMRSTRIVGGSAKTLHVLRSIDKVSRGRWPVLILGETGTGKEVAARTIHEQSSSGEPFVTIDCSSLVGPLMESELFGHARGAFTGAVGSKLGLIEAANGGSAFFDEIGELPMDVQAKLLRVLQEKEFRPVGSLATRRSDFRIIAATNRDLAKEVDRGAFRRDLYYRLNVVTIKLAPLRDRREDIPPLIDHFLGTYGHEHHLTAEAREMLVNYDWPGNVRELENCIQQMVAIHSGPLLHTNDLPSPLQNHFQVANRGLAMAVASGSSMTSNGTTESAARLIGEPGIERMPPVSVGMPPGHRTCIIPLDLVEKQAILAAIEQTNGDRGQAATMLGIGRTTLYRKLKEYGFAV